MLYFSPFIHEIRHNFFSALDLSFVLGICLGWNKTKWNELKWVFICHSSRKDSIRFDLIRMFRENATRPSFKSFQIIKLKVASPLRHSYNIYGVRPHSLSSLLSACFSQHQMNSTQLLRINLCVLFSVRRKYILMRSQQRILRIHTWRALKVWFILTFDVYTIESIDTLTYSTALRWRKSFSYDERASIFSG